MILDLFKRQVLNLINNVKLDGKTRAELIAEEDAVIAVECSGRYFSINSRPVIRWIKGDGLDAILFT